MKIIISPAKKMKADGDTLPWRDLPRFLPQAKVLYDKLRSMPFDALQKLWRCNDRIAALNVERLKMSGLQHPLAPAILAYEGIQYQYMAPNVFTQEQFDYVQEHLYILSGLYGVLRPFDGVIPYRLEMQAKLEVSNCKDLYEYWGGVLSEEVCRNTDCVVNLASKEYSVCISRYQKPEVRLITCVFGEEEHGRVVEKGTLCKMARGEMVRFMAEHRIVRPEDLKEFSGLNYAFSRKHSDAATYTFLLKRAKQI